MMWGDPFGKPFVTNLIILAVVIFGAGIMVGFTLGRFL